jgi:catechol 2,3-dioxygenase-like lactoylglutathione lyase family enzyme
MSVRAIIFYCFLISCPLLATGQTPKRPAITGVSHVAVYAKDQEASKRFYGELLELPLVAGRDGVFAVGSQQVIEIEKMPSAEPESKIAHVAFATADAEAMRKYLVSRKVSVPESVHGEKDGTRWFQLQDPEGHTIEFVQQGGNPQSTATSNATNGISQRMIHAGFVVRNREAQDRFYKDVLGFRVYWHGGMKDNETDWMDMQVPDGQDWLEYMLVRPESKLDARTLGILNHIALGTPDIKKAAHQLESRGWKSSEDEHAQIGRDGKWQLNLYDPDSTRVELMEFTPVQKPCCSGYRSAHPHQD